MQRVAAISDIHGNLPALDAVLADIQREAVDGVVVVGDTVAGPWPVEVFDRVAALGAEIVRGNADRAVLERDERFGPNPPWCADHLGVRRLAAVADWPLTRELAIHGLGRVLVCHATPASDEPVYTRLTPEHELLGLLGDVDADVVLCGHTHAQFDRQLSSGLRIVNPGSVGMPYEGERGAFWAVLGPDVVFKRTSYDVEETAAAIERLDAHVDNHGRFLLEPPTAEEAAVHFEKLRGA